MHFGLCKLKLIAIIIALLALTGCQSEKNLSFGLINTGEPIRAASSTREPTIYSNEITVESRMNNDMSISWMLSDEHDFINDINNLRISFVTNDGTVRWFTSTSEITSFIEPDEIIRIMMSEYPMIVSCIRVSYNEFDHDSRIIYEWYFDIQLSDISVNITEDAIKPGVYTRYFKQWVPESITLAGGYYFKENAYYLLTSREVDSDSPLLGFVDSAIFMSSETSNTFRNSDEPGRQRFQGSVFLGDIYIQEIVVTGDPQSGFVLYITPRSDEVFVIVEGSER